MIKERVRTPMPEALRESLFPIASVRLALVQTRERLFSACADSDVLARHFTAHSGKAIEEVLGDQWTQRPILRKAALDALNGLRSMECNDVKNMDAVFGPLKYLLEFYKDSDEVLGHPCNKGRQ